MIENNSMPKVFVIEDKRHRSMIKEKLSRLSPDKVGVEAYCEYVMTFINGKNKLHIKQYESGKLVIQGKNEDMLPLVLDIIESFGKAETRKVEEQEIVLTVNMPIIGTDESGKGDYFGPLVVCAMFADEDILKELTSLGVKDSKTISDVKCESIAKEIRKQYPDKFAEIVLLPKEYNRVYGDFKKQGKSLNQLLGYLHAQVINQIYLENEVNTIIVDKFGKESDVQSYLIDSVDKKKVKQIVRGERNPVVAAASILARDRFVSEMNIMSENMGIKFPLGAGPAVLECARGIVHEKGVEYLNDCAKVHFVITEQATKLL